jgi:pyrimidine operon attenuation protein/uracil phosphoribosyltransferase
VCLILKKIMNHSSSKQIIDIPDFGGVQLSVDNQSQPWQDLFSMAVRKNNSKRNFLFVSKVLAKHIPVQPNILFDACRQLVDLYNRKRSLHINIDNRLVCKESTLIIGFAETATAMGHGIFDQFDGEVFYVHTTRDQVDNASFAFEFIEEHSHASEQLFFLQNEDWIRSAKEIFIVDDEVTTGKTIRNLIDQIERYYPGKRYQIFSFLDWRNAKNIDLYEQYQKKKNIKIEFYSLIKGSIDEVNIDTGFVDDITINSLTDYSPLQNGWMIHECNLPDELILSGRNGVSVCQRDQMQKAVGRIVGQIEGDLKGDKRSVIGTGEFMYLPMKCAENFPGENYCNATTRSPIIPNKDLEYGVNRALAFYAPYDPDRIENLYNVNVNNCDEVVLFFENKVSGQQLNSLLMALDSCQYTHKHIVFCKG